MDFETPERPNAKPGEFRGKPMIVIPLGKDRNGKEIDWAFGVRKARSILEYIEDIKDFVKANE